MLMSEETRNKLNELIGEFFTRNSEADNFAYNLANSGYNLITAIYHKSFAHAFTSDLMADGLSDIMDILDARSVRLAVPEHDFDYGGDLKQIFADNEDMCARCRDKIIEAIEISELNGDYEAKIWCEELLMRFAPYYKQARVWAIYADKYVDDYKSFNVHFEEITTYINVIK